MQRKISFLLPAVFGILMALAALAGTWLDSASYAAPAAIPTPIAAPAGSGTDAQNVVFFSADVLAADTRSNSVQLIQSNTLDLQYVIDQTDVNTVTLTLNYSNDPLCTSTPASAEWSTGLAIVSANDADADEMVQLQNYGRCTSINADVTNTNEVTVTVRAVAK